MKKSSTTKRKPAKGTGASAKRATTPSATKGKAAAPAKGARKGRAHVEPNAALKRATKKTTTKPRPRLKAKAAPAPPMRTAIKVLRAGKSWHGGTHAWDLPTQREDGSWVPGAWTPRVTPHLCSTGYHLTRDPVQWWADAPDVIAYLAEYDGRVDDRGEDKFSVERCRLLRPLNETELAAVGIYLTGEHDEVTNARLVGGAAHIKHLADCKVRWMTGSARVDWMDGSARVDRMTDSARVDRMDGSARVDWMTGSARVDRMDGSARVDWMTGSARVDRMDGSARVDRMTDSARVDRMDGSARVDWMTGSARVDWMTGSARVDRMTGSARVDRMDGEATAHAGENAVVIVCRARPTVTVRGRASVLDYRPTRPAHYVADEGQVLTLAGDGTVSQAPASEAADAR